MMCGKGDECVGGKAGQRSSSGWQRQQPWLLGHFVVCCGWFKHGTLQAGALASAAEAGQCLDHLHCMWCWLPCRARAPYVMHAHIPAAICLKSAWPTCTVHMNDSHGVNELYVSSESRHRACCSQLLQRLKLLKLASCKDVVLG
jgi:hypothetical protein